MDYYFYCKGCHEVIVRKYPLRMLVKTYCLTAERNVRLYPLTQEEAKDLRYLLGQAKK